jgi:hypothetical protein
VYGARCCQTPGSSADLVGTVLPIGSYRVIGKRLYRGLGKSNFSP